MDFSPIARGGEAMGAGIAGGIGQIGQAIQKKGDEKKQYKQAISSAKQWIQAAKTMEGVLPPQVLQRLDQLGETISDEEIPLSQRGAAAAQIAGMGKMLFGEAVQRMMEQPSPQVPLGQILSENTDAETGKVNLTATLQDLDAMNAPKSYYSEARLAAEAVEPVVEEPEDMGLENTQAFVDPKEGKVKLYGLTKDGEWVRRYRDDSGEMVTESKPDEWMPLSAAKGATPTGTQFIEMLEELRDTESGLQSIESFAASREDAGTGVEFLKNRMGGLFKTLLGSKQKLSEGELNAMLSSGRLRALVGKFRVETVGPGIMTEEDARRIEDALGGALLTGNPEKVEIMLEDLINSRRQRAALLRTNLKASQALNPQLRQYELPNQHKTPQVVTSQAEWEALEPGTLYITEDGQTGRKQ